MRSDHLKPTLKEKKAAIKDATAEHAKLTQSLGKAEAELASLKSKMDAIDFSDEKESALQAERAVIAAAHAKAADRVDSLSAKLSGLQFSFSDPVKGFDRSKVR